MASTTKQAKAKLKQNLVKEQEEDEFSTDWDIDSYRTEHENDEHWQLRRSFMETHKHKFPEDRLVCLAQVFVNVEFLGCRYPEETMSLVTELSEDVAKEFRASRANCLKRTFIAASDAAEQRAKGRRSAPEQQQQQQQQQMHDGPSTSKAGMGFVKSNDESRNYNRGQQSNFQSHQRYQQQWQSQSQNWQNASEQSYGKRNNAQGLFSGVPYGSFVLQPNAGRESLNLSAQRSRTPYEQRITGSRKVEIFLNGSLIGSAEESNLKASKALAFKNAIETIQRQIYIIKENPLQDIIVINKKDSEIVADVVKSQVGNSDSQKLDATNKGYRMMKMMGWTGGGLGSNKQGREDPINYLLKNNRYGLGNQRNALNKEHFQLMLSNYRTSDDVRQLQFEPSFTKDERAVLHEIARRFNLKSVAHGKDEKRYLTICKNTIKDTDVLTEVLINKNPAFCNRFLVQVPEEKAKEYPDHTQHLELTLHQ